jgi:transporter family-2 protein
MPTALWMLVLAAICVGALPPSQAGINATLARHYGHPLWGALTNTVVASLVLVVAVVAVRPAFPDLRAMAAAPAWSWLGGLCGATMVFSAIMLAPRLGAAGYVTAMTVGTVTASLCIDHFGLLGFHAHPVSGLRLLGGAFVVAGMLLVQTH